MIWGTKEEQEKGLSVTKVKNIPSGFIYNYLKIRYLESRN